MVCWVKHFFVCLLTDSINHVDTVVEALHQLTLGLGGGLDEQLGGGDKLPGLRGQELLGPDELGLIPLRHVATGTQGPRLPNVLHNCRHNLLGLLEHDQAAGGLERVIV